MNAPAFFWAKIWLRLGIVLLLVGIAPMVLQQVGFADSIPVMATLVTLTVAPLGAVCVVIGIILVLVAWARRPQEPS